MLYFTTGRILSEPLIIIINGQRLPSPSCAFSCIIAVYFPPIDSSHLNRRFHPHPTIFISNYGLYRCHADEFWLQLMCSHVHSCWYSCVLHWYLTTSVTGRVTDGFVKLFFCHLLLVLEYLMIPGGGMGSGVVGIQCLCLVHVLLMFKINKKLITKKGYLMIETKNSRNSNRHVSNLSCHF